MQKISVFFFFNVLETSSKRLSYCSRKNFKSLFSAGIVLAVGVSNLHISSNENDWCHSARVTSPGNIKGSTNHSRPLFTSSLASSRTDSANMREHILSLLFLFSSRTHYHEESTSNLWTIGVCEIILSSFIFPSKPTDPRRNKLDIFNSCFDFNILIPVLTTAFQLLLWLQHLNSCPDDSISTPTLTSAF